MTADDVERERAAAVARHETEQHTNGQRRAEELAAELQAQARQFRVTVTAPDGAESQAVVDREQLDWLLPAADFMTDLSPAWTVEAEPIET